MTGVGARPEGLSEVFQARSRGLGAWGVVRLAGGLDLSTVRMARSELTRAERETARIVLDLRAVSFMDSTGVHMIVEAVNRLRERDGRLVVARGPRAVQGVLELTRVAEMVELIDDPIDFLAQDPPAGGFVRPVHARPTI